MGASAGMLTVSRPIRIALVGTGGSLYHPFAEPESTLDLVIMEEQRLVPLDVGRLHSAVPLRRRRRGRRASRSLDQRVRLRDEARVARLRLRPRLDVRRPPVLHLRREGALEEGHLRRERDGAALRLAHERAQAPILGFDHPRDEDDLVLGDFEVVFCCDVLVPLVDIVPDEGRELDASVHHGLLCGDVHEEERALLCGTLELHACADGGRSTV